MLGARSKRGGLDPDHSLKLLDVRRLAERESPGKWGVSPAI
jgi:hypothetical protein